MASLPLDRIRPRDRISGKTTPAPLREALREIASRSGPGLWLVGGTALAGYYAEHRRSDDLDLFAADDETHRGAVLAAKGLGKLGASFRKETTTPNFYKAFVEFKGHSFTIDVVLDENLHRVGQAVRTEDGVSVATLPTLFASKSACLLSRASEKDFYDLAWIFGQIGKIDVAAIVESGREIDGGINVEGVLISLQGTQLREEACGFLLHDTREARRKAFREIEGLRRRLIRTFLDFQHRQPLSSEAQALREALKDQEKD